MAKQKKQTTTEAVLELTTGSVEETQAFGEQLGTQLRAGDVVALQGQLGTGKTTLVQGIALGAGVTGVAVKSPTFVLVRDYPGPVPVIHIDAYRLEGAPSAAWLDLDLLIGPEKITLIEWAERVESVLPPDHLILQLEHASATKRKIRVIARGARSSQIASALPQTTPAEPAAETARETEEGKTDVAGG